MRIVVTPRRAVSAVLEALLMRKPSNPHFGADDEPEYITDDLPPIGMKVEVVGYLGGNRHMIPFLCCWTAEGWVVAGSRRKLAFNVAGWRHAGV